MSTVANERRYENVVDKSAWGEGPWQSEPDKVQWTDPTTGLPCLIVRSPSGALCGYVGIAEGHPAFEQDYSNVDVEVHGGLTYADHCQTGPENHAICHIPEPGQSDHVWWLGFDCAHLNDLAPKYASLPRVAIFSNEVYRDMDYVRGQVTDLARQLAELSA